MYEISNHDRKQKLGRPCATLIFERGNLRGTLLEVADDFGIAFSGEKLESMHAGCLRDVIKRDLSFQTRRQSSRNSSGVLRKYADRRWLAVSKNGPDSPCTVFQITVRYGSTWRGCRRRGTQKLKTDVRWLRIVLRCCSDVVELDLSFKTRIRMPSNSSGVLRTRFRSVFGPFGARGRVSGALSGRFWAHF